jgi:hypothetical protein
LPALRRLVSRRDSAGVRPEHLPPQLGQRREQRVDLRECRRQVHGEHPVQQRGLVALEAPGEGRARCVELGVEAPRQLHVLVMLLLRDREHLGLGLGLQDRADRPLELGRAVPADDRQGPALAGCRQPCELVGLTQGAHFGHRDHSDRSIVISQIGGS